MNSQCDLIFPGSFSLFPRSGGFHPGEDDGDGESCEIEVAVTVEGEFAENGFIICVHGCFGFKWDFFNRFYNNYDDGAIDCDDDDGREFAEVDGSAIGIYDS